MMSAVPKALPGIPKVDQLELPVTTTLTANYKQDPTQPDVELTQTYTAKVNGSVISVPVSGKPTTYGKSGTITQTFDFTPVTQALAKEAKRTYQRNWEISTGLGVESGSLYVPIEIQRNYSKSRAVSLEFHLKPQNQMGLSGVEVKHTWSW